MTTRLTKCQKQALARAIIDDLPPLEDRTNDFKEAAVFALKDLVPANILQLWKSGSPYIKTAIVWGSWHGGKHQALCAPYAQDFSTPELERAMEDSAVAAIFEGLDKAMNEREKLECRIYGAVNSVSTVKAFRQRFPEFAKYLPEEAQATNLPADANLITDLMQAGWPKEKK